MRDIKFRAWDKTARTFYFVSLSDNGWSHQDTDLEGHELSEWQQYTGLKDKNDVEIWEGDIVKILYTDWPSQLDSHPELSHDEYLDSLTHKEIVVWHQSGFWLAKKIGGYPQSIHPGQHGYIEVIGSVYESPELLKEED